MARPTYEEGPTSPDLVPRGLHRPLSVILRERSDARRTKLRSEVDGFLARAVDNGVKCEIVGSFARASSLFQEGSDVDVLVLSSPGLGEEALWEMARQAIKSATPDLIFARDLSRAQIRAMRSHAKSAAGAARIVHLKLAQLESASATVRRLHEDQLSLKAMQPTWYAEPTHVGALVTLVQAAYSNAERLIDQVVELVFGSKLPKGASWHRDVIEMAAHSAELGPLIGRAAEHAMWEVLAFTSIAMRGYYSASSQPVRAFEQVRNLTHAVDGLGIGVRRLLRLRTVVAP